MFERSEKLHLISILTAHFFGRHCPTIRNQKHHITGSTLCDSIEAVENNRNLENGVEPLAALSVVKKIWN